MRELRARELIARGEFGKMVCLRAGEIGAAPIEEAVREMRRADPNGSMIRAAQGAGIMFGDFP